MAQTSPTTAKELVYVSWCLSCQSSKKVWEAIEMNLKSLKHPTAMPSRDGSPADKNNPEELQNQIDLSCFVWRDANTWMVDHSQVDINKVVQACRLAIVIYSPTYGVDLWCRQQELPLLLEAYHKGLISLVWLRAKAGEVPRQLKEITPLIKYTKTLWSTDNRSQSAVNVARAVLRAWSEADVVSQALAEEREGLPGGDRVASAPVNASHLAIVIEPTGDRNDDKQSMTYTYALYRRIPGTDAYVPPHDYAASTGQIRGDYPYPWLVEQPESNEEPARLVCPILERYLQWAQQQPEPFVVEIFAPDELLDQDWPQLHVPAGDERQWLIHAHPFLLLARSRLLSSHTHKSDYLAQKVAVLSRGTGQWVPADGLTKSHRFKTLMTRQEQVALRWSGPMAAHRHECVKGMVHSMVPLALWPRHPVDAASLATSLVTLGLSDPATGRPCCADLDQFAFKRWENAEDMPVAFTIVVDDPARRPPSLLDRQQLAGSDPSLYISA